MNIFKSFGIYAGGQAVNAGIRFLLIPYYSYLLSVSDFGKVGMVWMFVPILTMLIGMGATASVSLKYYKIENELRENLLNFAFAATFVLFLCIGTVVFFAHPVLEQLFLLDVSRTDYIKLVCAAYGAFLIEFILGWFKIRIEPQRFVLFNTLYTLISIGFLLFFLAVLGRGFLGFIDGTMYGNLTMALLLVLVYVSSCKAFQIQLPRGVVMDLIHLSAPIVVGFAVSYVMTYSGRYVLAQVSTMDNVGIYTMGTRLGDAFNVFFVVPFLTAINPVLFKLFAEDRTGFIQSMKRYFNIYLLSGAFLLLLANAALDVVFRFLIHEQYIESVLIAQVSFWGMLVFGLSQLVGTVNLVRERIRLVTLFSICCGSINLSLTYLLVPIMGVVGAINASVISYAVLLSLQFFSSQRAIYVDYEIKKAVFFIGGVLIAFFLQLMMDRLFLVWWMTAGMKFVIVLLSIYLSYFFHIYEDMNLFIAKLKERIG